MELHDIMKEPWLPSDATVSLIQSIGEEVDYRRGSLLVEQGKRSYYFYIIKKGMCRSFYSDEDYEDTNLFAKDGDIIKEKIYSLIDKSKIWKTNNLFSCPSGSRAGPTLKTTVYGKKDNSFFSDNSSSKKTSSLQ